MPTTSMQNQIHELAKTLPAPRKQNTACDACRARKVKCNRLPGQDKCQHCLSKNYPCTHYVQQATSEKKRTSTVARRPRNLSNSRYVPPIVVQGQSAQPMDEGQSPPSPSSSSSPGPSKLTSPNVTNGSAAPSPFPQSALPTTPVYKHGAYPPISHKTPTREILAYLFSPPEPTSDLASLGQPRIRSPYADWGEMANRLEDDDFRAEFVFSLYNI
jgi:hypothetical protein